MLYCMQYLTNGGNRKMGKKKAGFSAYGASMIGMAASAFGLLLYLQRRMPQLQSVFLEVVIVGVIMFFVLGIISHVLITKYRNEYGKDDKKANYIYRMTMVAYIIPFVVVGIVFLLLCFIDWLTYVFFDKHYVAAAINSIKRDVFGIKPKPKRRRKAARTTRLSKTARNASSCCTKRTKRTSTLTSTTIVSATTRELIGARTTTTKLS